MNAIIFLAGLMASAPAQTLVVVPERDTLEACVANETVASILRLAPSLRVLRAGLQKDETLAHLARRAEAFVVIDGRHDARPERPHTTLELLVRGRPADRRTMYGDVQSTFDAMWPKDLPQPARVAAFAAANHEALAAACQNHVEEALAYSAGAIGDAVRRRLSGLPAPVVAPPAKNGRVRSTVLERWLDASRLIAKGDHGRAYPLLLAVKNELAAGVSAPLWYRPAAPELELHSVQVEAELVFLFGRERLLILDLASGQERLSLSVSKLEPKVVMLSPKRALAFSENRVIDLDLGASPKLRREFPLDGVAPEASLGDGDMVLAGRSEVVALSLEKDRELWRQELTDNLVAGPMMLDDRLIVPGDARLFVLARDSGKLVESLDLPDELSGPLHSEPTGLYMVLGGDRVARLTWNGSPNLVVWDKDLFGASWPPVGFEDSIAIATRAPRKPPMVTALGGTDRPFVKILERGAGTPLARLPGGGLVHADARRTTLTGKDAKGRIVMRARSSQPFEQLVSGKDHVLAQAGSMILALGAARGETVQRIELPGSPTAAALSDLGGVALMPDGGVYGLPPIDDRRMRVFEAQVRRDLAEAAVQSGRGPQAKKLAEEILASEPDDLDALAIVARASPRNVAASAWYRVLERAPRLDPLHETADTELAKLSGMKARVPTEAPLRQVFSPTDEVLIVEFERRVMAVAPNAPSKALWSLPKQQAAPLGLLVRVDDQLVDPKTGKGLRALRGRRPLDGRGLYFLSTEKELVLSLENERGEVVFSQSFEERTLRLLDASSEFVALVDDSDLGIVHVLSKVDGSRRWMRPFEERVEAAHLSADTLVLRTATRLIGVEPDTGKLVFETKLPKDEAVTQSLGTSAGLLLVSQKRLTLYDMKRGRAARVLPLEKPVALLALSDPFLLVSLEDGTLTAFDLARGRRGGRLALSAPTQLFSANGLFGVVEAEGAAFSLFEAQRLLNP